MANTAKAGRKIPLWAMAAVAILAIPAIAMQVTDEVNWTAFDFVFLGALLFAAGGAYELLARKSASVAYRFGAAVALGTALLLIVSNGAVGLIGGEGEGANLLYVGVVAVAVSAALLARFRAAGMAGAMAAAAGAQVLAPLIALMAGLAPAALVLSLEVAALTAFFAGLWLLSAFLFVRAARSKAA